jgi:hypothetical protein
MNWKFGKENRKIKQKINKKRKGDLPAHGPFRVCLDGGTRKDKEGWDEIILI